MSEEAAELTEILESLAKLEHQELNKMPAKQPELSIPSKGKDNMVIGAQTSWGATFKLVSDDSYLKGKKGVFTKAEALAMTKLDEETKKACFDIKNTFDCYLLPDPIRVIKEVIRIFPNQKLKGWVPLNSSWMDKDKYTEPPQERE